MTIPTIDQYRAARNAWADFRADYGMAHTAVPMISFGGNTKTAKNEVATYDLSLSHANNASDGKISHVPTVQGNGKNLTAVVDLIDADVQRSGKRFTINTCPFSTPACRSICVASTGKGGLASVKYARAVKTRFYAEHPELFRIIVAYELGKAVRKHGEIMARLNCYSDIKWELVAPEFFTIDGVSFYDYTKHPLTSRPVDLSNYRVTRSATERTTDEDIATMVAAGETVAVVVKDRIQNWDKKAVPTAWNGLPAVNGDASDDRFNDPRGVVVLLGAKGPKGPVSPMARELV